MALIKLKMNIKHIYERHVLKPDYAPIKVEEITYFIREISENLEDFINKLVDFIAKVPFCSQQDDGRYFFYVKYANEIGFRVKFCQSETRVAKSNMHTVKIILGRDEKNNNFYIANAFPCDQRPVKNRVVNPLLNNHVLKISPNFSFRRSRNSEMWPLYAFFKGAPKS
jgi:hypothetical protein